MGVRKANLSADLGFACGTPVTETGGASDDDVGRIRLTEASISLGIVFPSPLLSGTTFPKPSTRRRTASTIFGLELGNTLSPRHVFRYACFPLITKPTHVGSTEQCASAISTLDTLKRSHPRTSNPRILSYVSRTKFCLLLYDRPLKREREETMLPPPPPPPSASRNRDDADAKVGKRRKRTPILTKLNIAKRVAKRTIVPILPHLLRRGPWRRDRRDVSDEDDDDGRIWLERGM